MAKNKPVTLFGVARGECSDQELQSCTSAVFEVTDRPVIVRGWNFGPGVNGNGEKIMLEMVAGANEGEFFEEVNNGCGCCVVLSACSNELIIAKSGRYRLNRCICDTTNPPTNTDIHVEYQLLDTGAHVTIGDFGMACKCEDGNRVSVTQPGDGSTVIVVDNVPTVIPAPAAGLALVSCTGAAVASGTAVATCADLAAAVAAAEANDLTLAQVAAAASVVLTDAFGVRLGAIFP